MTVQQQKMLDQLRSLKDKKNAREAKRKMKRATEYVAVATGEMKSGSPMPPPKAAWAKQIEAVSVAMSKGVPDQPSVPPPPAPPTMTHRAYDGPQPKQKIARHK